MLRCLAAGAWSAAGCRSLEPLHDGAVVCRPVPGGGLDGKACLPWWEHRVSPVRRAAGAPRAGLGCRAARRSAVSAPELASAGWEWLPGEVRAWQLLVSVLLDWPLWAWQGLVWRPLVWRRQDEPERVLKSVAAAVPQQRAWRPWLGSPLPACSPLVGAPELPVWRRQDGSELVVPG